MGMLLRDEDLVPDYLVCSSAVRTHKTALLAAEACSYTGEIKPTRELYLAEPQDYIEVLRQVAKEHTCVLVVGHNPGLEMLVEALTGEAAAMPTAALAHIELSLARWSDLDLNTKGRLVKVWRPGDLE